MMTKITSYYLEKCTRGGGESERDLPALRKEDITETI